MTDAATLPSLPADTRATVQRRLIGLAVLLLFFFLLSLLLRTGNGAPDALPSVVIPLGGDASATATTPSSGNAPTLDVPEPSSEGGPVATAPVTPPPKPEPKPATSAVTAKPPVVAKPAPAKPRIEKPQLAQIAKPVKPTVAAPATAKPAAAPRWFVVVGAYKDPMAAQAIANRVRLAGLKADSVAVTSAGEKLNRVRAGPFVNKEAAESARATLIVEGLTKAVTVSEK